MSFLGLDLDIPIIQAPMAGVQDHRLAAAVCNVGALGSLPCAMLGAEDLKSELTALRSKTSGPFNINFFCHTPPEPDAKREAAWRRALGPYYAELGVDPTSIPEQPGRRPFSHDVADVVEEFKPAVVSFHFGLPAPDLVARVRAWGAKILASATTLQEGRWLEAHGVDAIIAQGSEAGGHRGMFLTTDISTQVGTFALVPQLARAVRVPVIAAGGIADAQGVDAAMALGAAAAQIGTSYLLCPEATTSAVHRAALVSDAARVTVITNVFTGRPARGIVNRLMRELGPMSSIAPDFPRAAGAVVPLRRVAEQRGSGDFSQLWAGQNVSGCREISAAGLTRELAGVRSKG